MINVAALRLGWGVLALPLCAVGLVATLATWPLVLSNSILRLVLISYVLILPLLPAVWSGTSRLRLLLWATATVAAQVITFGFLNLWF